MGAIKFYTILPWGTIIMCATINFLQNLPQGTVIRAVLLLGSEEYTILIILKSHVFIQLSSCFIVLVCLLLKTV